MGCLTGTEDNDVGAGLVDQGLGIADSFDVLEVADEAGDLARLVGAESEDLGSLRGGADHGGDGVREGEESGREEERDFAVAAEDEDVGWCHSSRLWIDGCDRRRTGSTVRLVRL